MDLHFTLDETKVNLMLTALGKLPLEQSVALWMELKATAEMQIRKAQELQRAADPLANVRDFKAKPMAPAPELPAEPAATAGEPTEQAPPKKVDVDGFREDSGA